MFLNFDNLICLFNQYLIAVVGSLTNVLKKEKKKKIVNTFLSSKKICGFKEGAEILFHLGSTYF